MTACNIVPGDEEFVRTQFCRAIKTDRVCCLIGGESDDFFDLVVDRSTNNVLRAVHIGFDTFNRIVFGDGKLA